MQCDRTQRPAGRGGNWVTDWAPAARKTLAAALPEHERESRCQLSSTSGRPVWLGHRLTQTPRPRPASTESQHIRSASRGTPRSRAALCPAGWPVPSLNTSHFEARQPFIRRKPISLTPQSCAEVTKRTSYFPSSPPTFRGSRSPTLLSQGEHCLLPGLFRAC